MMLSQNAPITNLQLLHMVLKFFRIYRNNIILLV